MKLLDMLQEKYVCAVPRHSVDATRYVEGGTVYAMNTERRYRITHLRGNDELVFVYGVEIDEDDSVVDRGWLVFTLAVCAVALFYVAAHFGAAVAP